MTRKRGASLQPAGRAFVYDHDPEEITRPDTVPAALRFSEDSALSSGIGHARPRELAPYPRVPEITAVPNDVATVVDPLPQQQRKELRSGPRHRVVSTVPPPSHARQKIARAENDVVIRSEEPARVPEPARMISTSPPATHATKRWPFALALLVTALASAAAGTTLGNGSLERLFASPPPSETKPAPPVAAVREVPRPAALAPSPRPAPPPEVDGAPVVRIEDLPLADEGTGTRTTSSGRPLRTKTAIRR